MTPHSRRWTLIGSHPEQSHLVMNVVADRSAAPVWRACLQETGPCAMPARVTGSRGPCVAGAHNPQRMTPHSRSWTPIGNHPEQSHLVMNVVADSSAAPVWRACLQETGPCAMPARVTGLRGPCVAGAHNPQRMTPHSRRWTPIGNHPEQSQSFGNMVAEQSARPVRRTSLQCKATSLKIGTSCGRSAAHERRTRCTVQLSWMGPRTFVAVPPQSFSPWNVYGTSCRSLPVDLADRPTTLPPRGPEQVLFWSKNLLRLLLLVPDLGPGRLIMCGPWLHTQRASICDRLKTMALSSVGPTPCSRNS